MAKKIKYVDAIEIQLPKPFPEREPMIVPEGADNPGLIPDNAPFKTPQYETPPLSDEP